MRANNLARLPCLQLLRKAAPARWLQSSNQPPQHYSISQRLPSVNNCITLDKSTWSLDGGSSYLVIDQSRFKPPRSWLRSVFIQFVFHVHAGVQIHSALYAYEHISTELMHMPVRMNICNSQAKNSNPIEIAIIFMQETKPCNSV